MNIRFYAPCQHISQIAVINSCGHKIFLRGQLKYIFCIRIYRFIAIFELIDFVMAFSDTTQLTAKQLDDIIKALAHPVRRNILHWLKTPEQYFADQDHPLSLGVCAGKIERQTGLSQSTVSAHLATLQRAGVINSQKVGQWHFFKRDDVMIGQFLAQISHQL